MVVPPTRSKALDTGSADGPCTSTHAGGEAFVLAVAFIGVAAAIGYLMMPARAPQGVSTDEALAECAVRALAVLQAGKVFMQPHFLSVKEAAAVRNATSSLRFQTAKFGESNAPKLDAKSVRKTEVASVADLLAEEQRPGGQPVPAALRGLVSRLSALRAAVAGKLDLNEDTELSLLRYPVVSRLNSSQTRTSP